MTTGHDPGGLGFMLPVGGVVGAQRPFPPAGGLGFIVPVGGVVGGQKRPSRGSVALPRDPSPAGRVPLPE